MWIEKTAKQQTVFHRKLCFFESARAAFQMLLHRLNEQEPFTLLLPGYIGFSVNEGSGIYDPVVQENIPHLFYPMNRSLGIKVDTFEKLLQNTSGKKVVLLVHYFGYLDAQFENIVEICRKNNAIIIEDSAHALFTDFVDHRCGNYGDFSIYSLHKMFPFTGGGMLKINTPMFEFDSVDYFINPLFDYDFYAIAKRRKANAKRWNELLSEHQDEIGILRPYSEDVTPQTFPVVLKNVDRNEMYFRLNEAGYGAVSLYHTMIQPIQNAAQFSDAVWLSQHIINLPVHQDVETERIDDMCAELLGLIYTDR